MNITIADKKLALESSLQDIESPMFSMYNTHHIYMRARTAKFHHHHPKKKRKERKKGTAVFYTPLCNPSPPAKWLLASIATVEASC